MVSIHKLGYTMSKKMFVKLSSTNQCWYLPQGYESQGFSGTKASTYSKPQECKGFETAATLPAYRDMENM